MANLYIGSVQYAAVAAWAANTAYVSTSNGGRGDYVRQLAAPAVNSERVFRCTTSGTSHLTTEPTWTLTKNATTADNTVVWTECTGQEADQVSGTWKAPHARLFTAYASTWGAAGDNFYVAHDHAETQAAALTLTVPYNQASYCSTVCVLATGTVPPVSADLRATATVTTTGANAMAIAIAAIGVQYWYGITFNCGTGATNVALTALSTSLGQGRGVFENCALKKLGTTAVTAAIILGNGLQGCQIDLINTTLEFGATGDTCAVRTHVRWRGPSSGVVGATLPTTLFGSSTPAGSIEVDGVDLSNLSGTIFAARNTATSARDQLRNCRLHASATIRAANNDPGSNYVDVIRSDSAATNYRHERYASWGAQTVETTIVRTGGASDGTTPIAWKIVTQSRAGWRSPFESMPIAIWNDSTAARTLTIYGIWGGGAVPDNDDLWAEVSYLGSADYPLGALATSGKADILAAAISYSTDGSAWGGSTTAFKITIAFTAAQKGFITVQLKFGLASTTFYIDPKVELS